MIGAINFGFNKSDITPEAKVILDKIAESLIAPTNAARTIDVTGNTDAIGSEKYNEAWAGSCLDQARGLSRLEGRRRFAHQCPHGRRDRSDCAEHHR
ncbi:MAG: OmpA family protein [Gemmatimonadaceae bacterium]|nr:OmpA family protein [Gemmatimonadaceae bacterium]